MGGDSPLTPEGETYAQALHDFFKGERVQVEGRERGGRGNGRLKDLRVWCSQKIRAVQTAKGLEGVAAHVEYWKVREERESKGEGRDDCRH